MHMTIRIDRESPDPPHRQIAQWVRTAIADGTIRPGTRIPTMKAFRTATGCAETTIGRAIRLLSDDGTVFTVPRRGTYASGGKIAS